jgi:hypothetical protein
LMPEDMDLPVESVTKDKGYYSTKNIAEFSEMIPYVNIPEPKKDRNLDKLTEAEREAILASRAFVQSAEGKALLKKRGMHIERSFAHILDCGGMRRTTLRGRENIQKRYSIAALGYNLSLAMRHLFGIGTPKQLAAASKKMLYFTFFILSTIKSTVRSINHHWKLLVTSLLCGAEYRNSRILKMIPVGISHRSTGC